ncbi:MAG: glucosyltransferase domain-containing protein [Ruminococcus sp.]|nr:glucosyltransferase domain-containing protein [Ruminococcus sp.]
MKILEIKKYITKKEKTAFISSIILFFSIHLFKIANFLPNHDSLGNFYSGQDIIRSGRWFLTVACLPSTHFDLPWVIGVLSALYIALTVVIIVRMFNIKNTSSIIITSALIISFPAVSETMLFGFTADGYFLSMLLATLSIRFVTAQNQRWYMYVIAGILLCLSCGIYQAYFTFAAALALIYLIFELLKNNETTKQLLLWCGKLILLFASALILYYIIWKIRLAIEQVPVSDYQGISGTGNFTLASITTSAVGMLLSLSEFIFGNKFYKGNISFYSVIGIVFCIAFLCVLCRVITKRQLLKEKGRFFFLCAALIAVPIVVYFWLFASPDTAYGARMLQGLSLLYLLPVLLSKRHLSNLWQKTSAILVFVLIALFSLQANTAYLFLNQCYEATYQTSSEMLQRAHTISESGEEKIAIVGDLVYESEFGNNPLSDKLGSLSGTLKSTLAYRHDLVRLFTKNTFNETLTFCSGEEVLALESHPFVAEMSCWPTKDSVRIIDGYIVIKLAEPISE